MEINNQEPSADRLRVLAAITSQACLTFSAAILIGVMGWLPAAFAANYYINSELGNDSWSGKLPIAAGNPSTDGPWQTLGRLATALLLPGDIVFLACGSTWNETLRIASSGTSAAPIVISAGPNQCEIPPTIDGAVTIPSHMWKQHNGAIYRARLPLEYISNPQLTENLNGWTHWAPRLDSSISLDTVCSGSPSPCMQFVSGTGTGYSIAISNNFPLAGGVSYSANVLVKAPAGTQLRFAIRRGGPTYESLTKDQLVTASGGWQTVSFTFVAARSAGNARFDIEVPNGQIKTNVREAHVQRDLLPSDVAGTFVNGAAIRKAHHPNFDRADVDPNSPFAPITVAGGKTTVDTANLPLPANASLTPGIGIAIRTHAWRLEERTVTSVSGTQLVLAQATEFPIRVGFGYFLTGSLWMLDSPGEWYFDSARGDLYVWMPDSVAPGNRVSFNSLTVGTDLRNSAYVDLVGLEIRRVGTGANLDSANAIRLRNITITEVADYGIDADSCKTCAVDQSRISKTGIEAIKALVNPTRFSITDNDVSQSGAIIATGGWRRLPRPSLAAIRVGPNASILRNRIVDSANNGILLGPRSIAEANYVARACLLLNDCAGIYHNQVGSNSSILGNVVEDIPGGLIGLPVNWPNQAVGIYLDDGSTSSVVSRNTVTGAEHGIHVHNANSATISENLLFGNRRYQLWMQEQTTKLRANGDIFDNHIESNMFVPVKGGPSVYLESEIQATNHFATFINNHYSALLSPRPIGEYWPTGSAAYNLAEWQAKGSDASGRVTKSSGYASFLYNGTNIVPNGNLANNRTGWNSWNQTAPYAQVAYMTCGIHPCLHITAGNSPSLLASPNFSVTEGQWYRVSFDAATSTEGQPISVLVRRGGGGITGYEALMPAVETFPGSTTLRRYSFQFQASKTIVANNPETGELGARVDFQYIQPGTSLTVANLEMVALTPVEAALQLRLLLNRSSSPTSISCSPADKTANLCDKLVNMKDDRRVDWSGLVDPLSGEATYTLDTTVADTDLDGVADQQDICPDTRPGAAVNAAGCGFDQ